jgi:adenylate cyclase
LRARELFRAAIATAPALAEGETWLARANAGILIYGWSKNPSADTAEGWQAAMRATRLAEADPYAHYALGIMSAAMGQPERTIAEAQKAIDLSPSFALGWLLLGMGRLFAGRAAQAVEPLQRGLRLNPHDPQAFIWLQLLAFAHLLSGGAEEAAQRAREAVAMRPESASGQAAIVSASVRLGRMDEARAAASALEQILKESPTALDEFLARFSQGDRERLVELLREAGWGR